jgi:6-phosphogluconate dehydrogenase
MLLVKAGSPVDEFINQLLPFLEPGDIIIDGGNSHFPDTIRRCKELEAKGTFSVNFIIKSGIFYEIHYIRFLVCWIWCQWR